ncbi:hypothetical protein B0H14DRAFT_2734023 [Mycena olivaceomarginata]|nr:hypothetical protein B0H14DRAFT_2734023 [Mycena olivaceomarginata]
MFNDAECLNEEVYWRFLSPRQYVEAVVAYRQAAALHEKNSNPRAAVCYSNLAALVAADQALQFDYTSIKARGLDYNMHSIVDLSTILVLDPKNADSRSNLLSGLQVHINSKLRAISTGDSLEVDTPPAYGIHLTTPRPGDYILPDVLLIEMSYAVPSTKPENVELGRSGYPVMKPRKKVKRYSSLTISGSRSSRPKHKAVCQVFADHGVLIELSTKLNRHIHMHELMRAYAVVALGLLGDTPFPSRAVVVFHLEMFSSISNARRLEIRRIEVLPLLALGDVAIGRYESICREMMEGNPGLIPLYCMICPNICKTKNNYASYNVAAVFPHELQSMKQPGFVEQVNSPIFGPRQLKMDLKNIFCHNFYRLRA